MRTIRIDTITTFDNKTMYRINEAIGDDLFITWPLLFTTKNSAKKEIEAELKIKLTQEQWLNLNTGAVEL